MTNGAPALTERDVIGLVFVAEMYGVQFDQLAAVLGLTPRQARPVATRWRERGLVESARLGPGPPWIWATRRGLAACDLRYREARPGLSRLAHLRAVTSVRLALEGTERYRTARAHWRGERRLRASCQFAIRDHLPDGEVHWPDEADVPWAGECWAIEAELTPKTLTRTVEIMRELLSRTGDYGCAPGDVAVPGDPPRHARVVYVCSPAALPTVIRARATLGADASRIEIRDLPITAALEDPLAAPAPAPATTTTPGTPTTRHTATAPAPATTPTTRHTTTAPITPTGPVTPHTVTATDTPTAPGEPGDG